MALINSTDLSCLPAYLIPATRELLAEIDLRGSVTPSKNNHHAAVRHLVLNRLVVQSGGSYSFTGTKEK